MDPTRVCELHRRNQYDLILLDLQMPMAEKRFMFMIQQTPHFALQIMRVMAERLRRMDERL